MYNVHWVHYTCSECMSLHKPHGVYAMSLCFRETDSYMLTFSSPEMTEAKLWWYAISSFMCISPAFIDWQYFGGLLSSLEMLDWVPKSSRNPNPVHINYRDGECDGFGYVFSLAFLYVLCILYNNVLSTLKLIRLMKFRVECSKMCKLYAYLYAYFIEAAVSKKQALKRITLYTTKHELMWDDIMI